MDIPGLVQSYKPRAPQYDLFHQFRGAPSVAYSQMEQNNLFSLGAHAGFQSNNPAFANNYIQQRPLPHLTQFDNVGVQGMSYARNTDQGFEVHQSQPIKLESQWSGPANLPSFDSANTNNVPTSATNSGNETNFGTEVDTLMKAIQAKTQTTTLQKPSSPEQSRPVVGVSRTPSYVQASTQARAYDFADSSQYKLMQKGVQEDASPKGGKKRYYCTIENCTKSFYQKTHLDIHERAHTGVKPYPCKEPGCGRNFSQLGNLKTHERRHTGERPYQCEICGKKFAQRGNVRAHKVVHDQSKPYLCRLDDCGKQFTQLGNLKSHQNKFHIDTIRSLTLKFASFKDGDIVHAADKELWEYFANLYKNSNKGIKGRGKDRKVDSNRMTLNSGVKNLDVNGRGEYSMSGAGRGNMIVGVGAGRGEISQYEMLDVDEESQSSRSGSTISVGICDDGLAFPERM